MNLRIYRHYIAFPYYVFLSRKELLTSQFYGHKVLRYLRTKKLESQWNQLHLKPLAERSLLGEAVVISQCIQIYHEKVPNLSHVQNLIHRIIDRVTQQLSHRACAQQSTPPAKILSSINQAMFKEMGFRCNGDDDLLSCDYYFIDKVGVIVCPCFYYQEAS